MNSRTTLHTLFLVDLESIWILNNISYILGHKPLLVLQRLEMLDRYSYTGPSRVRTLLVPINGCSEVDFARYLGLIRTNANEVRLLDVPPLAQLQYFNPQTFPQGKVMFDYVSHAPDTKSIFLHDFEPFRKTFIVIGVGKHLGKEGAKETPEEVVESLKKWHPSAIVHNIIYFDTPSDIIDDLNPASDHSTKMVFYHDGSIEHNITALETLMCEVTRNFLIALDNYASSYVNITLRSPVSISDTHNLTKAAQKAQKRVNSGSASFKVPFSSSSSTNNTPNLTDVKSKSQQKHKGRQAKLLGSFHLLAGKYSDALEFFTDSISNLKKCDDYLWLGSALEGIGNCAILLHYLGNSYQLQNTSIISVLQISKSKFQALATAASSMNGESLSPKRISSDSLSNVTNTSGNVHGTKFTSINNNSTSSPRNSSSSGINFNFASSTTTGGVPDLNSLPIPELIRLISSKVLQYYHLSTGDFENVVPDLVYVESLLRSIKFMICIYLGGNELNSVILDSIVNSSRIEKNNFHPDKEDHKVWFCKSDILKEIDKVFSLQLVDMSLIEQCRIYCCLASMYSDLELYRKRAFILRILLVGLLPKLESAVKHKENGVDLDTRQDISLVAFEGATYHDDQASSIRQIFDSLFDIYKIKDETESSLVSASNHAKSNWSSLQLSLLKLCLRISETMKDYAYFAKLCTLILTRYSHCLPVDDQYKLKEKIEWLSYMSHKNNSSIAIPYWDPYLVRKVKFISHRKNDELIPFSEYEKTANNVGLVDTASTAMDKMTAPSVSNQPFIFNPFNKPKPSAINKDRLLIKDEIYQLKISLQNPFAFEVEINDLSVVTEGGVKVQTLMNLLKPASGIVQQPSISQSPNLSSYYNQSRPSGLNSKTRPAPQLSPNQELTQPTILHNNNHQVLPTISITNNTINNPLAIAPKSIQQFLVAFKPLESGELFINGFNISISNCQSQFFHIADKEIYNGLLKVKNVGPLDSENDLGSLDKVIKNLVENKIESRAVKKCLSLTVVPPQPNLTLISMLVTNGWLMLLEGEKFKFSISLSNQSDELINYLSFSFWDSTIEPLNKKLSAVGINNSNNPNISTSDIYEIEWLLLKFKPFRIINKDVISKDYKTIGPRGDINIDYEVTGKRGMNELKIILEYSNKQANDSAKSFVKYVHVPLYLSVVPALEIVGFDILPLLSSSLYGLETRSSITQQGDLIHENLEKVLQFISKVSKSQSEKISDYCLLIIDLKNSWNEKLSSDLTYQVTAESNFNVREKISPGKTVRFLLPIKRISNKDVDLTKPIPSLRNKQYIKNYLISDDEETTMRQLFWLRSNILNNISGHWETIPNNDPKRRSGDVELRNIRLTPKMANILVYTKIQIHHMLLSECEQQIPINRTGSHFCLDTEEFYTLRTTIINNSDSQITGMLRHLPFSMVSAIVPSTLTHGMPHNSIKNQMSIDRRILINGVPQKHIGPEINPGESKVIDTSFVILEKGEYEWGSVLDVLNKGDLKIADREPIYLLAS